MDNVTARLVTVKGSRTSTYSLDGKDEFAENVRAWPESCGSNIPGRFIIRLRLGYGGTSRMNRGDRREAIFRTDLDGQWFHEALGQVCLKTGWQVRALCLRSKHFHLVVETPKGNLVAGKC